MIFKILNRSYFLCINSILINVINFIGTPLVNWKLESCDLKYCHWSNINPSLFFVLDNEENIYVFDLFNQNLSPLIKDHSNKKLV